MVQNNRSSSLFTKTKGLVHILKFLQKKTQIQVEAICECSPELRNFSENLTICLVFKTAVKMVRTVDIDFYGTDSLITMQIQNVRSIFTETFVSTIPA